MPNDETTTGPDYTSIVDDAWGAREANEAANKARVEAHAERTRRYESERAAISAAQEKLNTLSENARSADNAASKAIDEAFAEQVGNDVARQYGVYV